MGGYDMVMLAIDTSMGTSVALVGLDGAVLSRHDTLDTMRHAEVVGIAIADVLSQAGLASSAVTCVAAGVGPGPFTGLRVGLAAAVAFATGLDCALHPTVSHDAIAWGHLRAAETAAEVRVITDARRREVYWSTYDGVTNGLPNRTAGPSLAKPDDLVTGPRDLRAEWLSAHDLAQVALAERARGVTRPFEPLYLRSPDVTMSAGPKRVSS